VQRVVRRRKSLRIEKEGEWIIWSGIAGIWF
jgi:hypothetical protein